MQLFEEKLKGEAQSCQIAGNITKHIQEINQEAFSSVQIKMYDMEFGESILVSNRNDCLLIDCGTERSQKTHLITPIEGDLNGFERKALLISHFHDDHINCIYSLYQQANINFNCIYLPDIFHKFGAINIMLLESYLRQLRADQINMWQVIKQILIRNQK